MPTPVTIATSAPKHRPPERRRDPDQLAAAHHRLTLLRTLQRLGRGLTLAGLDRLLTRSKHGPELATLTVGDLMGMRTPASTPRTTAALLPEARAWAMERDTFTPAELRSRFPVPRWTCRDIARALEGEGLITRAGRTSNTRYTVVSR